MQLIPHPVILSIPDTGIRGREKVKLLRDASRKASPLKPATDAVVVDNSDLDEAATLAMVLEEVRNKL